MVAGFDRYFQIARCFRDEDLRANRQPEFTQLDVEMSFVEDEDVIGTMENLVVALAKEFTGETLTLPLPRVDYADSMERFGNDRPDLRYGMELKDVADIAAETEFKVFQQAAAGRPPDPGDLRPRRRRGVQPEGPRRPDRVRQDLRRQRPGLAQGRGRGPRRPDRQVLPRPGPGQAPRAVRRQGRRPDPDRRRHPGRLQPGALEPPDPPGRRAEALRPQELTIIPGSSGSRSCTGTPRRAGTPPSTTRSRCPWPRTCTSWRPTRPRSGPRPTTWSSTARSAAAGRSAATTRRSSRGSSSCWASPPSRPRRSSASCSAALKNGAPPHGGIALGVDRLVMLYAGLTNIRDCIAFPKTAKGTDLMTGAPGTVDARQLRELHVRVDRMRRRGVESPVAGRGR